MAQPWDQDTTSLNLARRMTGKNNLLGPRCNVSKVSTENSLDNSFKLRPELFRERGEICGHSALYIDDMTMIINKKYHSRKSNEN